ncbi:L,D-transpeptidase [Lentzea californiensis]|uniref:L,D-transpeptidase n=1 Tax=Lentzea californiensis TaxID=438851 RepID=UPI0021645209|nr:L,D-transpeptidase [Lentzea californiensis]MCR3747924.1 L,D-transpeptidase catalytic domain [Lentzea californiensis]
MRMLLVAVALMSVAGCAQGAVHAETPAAPPHSASPSASPPSEAPPSTPSSTPAPPPPPPPPPVVKPTPCTISDGACIQLSTNQSWVVRGDKIVYGPTPITHGRRGFETPLGNFPVLRKVKDEWSRPYNAAMPWSTYFTESGIAFHEGSLTDPSHGCIHLDPPSAKYYFTNLSIGDTVQVVS